MAHPITQDHFREVLFAARKSNLESNPLVVIHSVSHFPYMSVAHSLNVEVIFSSIDLTKEMIEQWHQDRRVVLLVDRVEVEQIEVILASRPELQHFQIFFVQ